MRWFLWRAWKRLRVAAVYFALEVHNSIFCMLLMLFCSYRLYKCVSVNIADNPGAFNAEKLYNVATKDFDYISATHDNRVNCDLITHASFLNMLFTFTDYWVLTLSLTQYVKLLSLMFSRTVTWAYNSCYDWRALSLVKPLAVNEITSDPQQQVSERHRQAKPKLRIHKGITIIPYLKWNIARKKS